MAGYIEREKVLTALEDATSWTDLRIRIDSIPAVDVMGRKTGKWIRVNDMPDGWCSLCGFGPLHDSPWFSYCPNCGCAMKEGCVDV